MGKLLLFTFQQKIVPTSDLYLMYLNLSVKNLLRSYCIWEILVFNLKKNNILSVFKTNFNNLNIQSSIHGTFESFQSEKFIFSYNLA